MTQSHINSEINALVLNETVAVMVKQGSFDPPPDVPPGNFQAAQQLFQSPFGQELMADFKQGKIDDRQLKYLLQEEAADRELDEFSADLEKINAAGKHLLALINDILDLSKIEAGKMELFLESFDVAKMIDEVASTVLPLVEKNANVLHVEMASDLGMMHADQIKVRQSLFNLLSNAAKFTREGHVTLDKVGNGRRWQK